MQNIVSATVELSLDETEWKFVDLPGNQLPPDKLQAFNWSKNNLAKMHKSQELGWAFTSLSCYSLLVKTIRGVYNGGINFIEKTLPLNKILEIEDCLMRSFFLGTMDEALVSSFNKGQPFTYSCILGRIRYVTCTGLYSSQWWKENLNPWQNSSSYLGANELNLSYSRQLQTSPIFLPFINQPKNFTNICNNMSCQFVDIHTKFTVFTYCKESKLKAQ